MLSALKSLPFPLWYSWENSGVFTENDKKCFDIVKND